MAKGRSPNCPTITLKEALDRGRKVYAQEHTHPADREVVAKDLGYSSLSGASATMIGALRQYGVLEGRGGGLRVSDDAVTAFELPVGSPEYTAAVNRMAFQPTLFRELHGQFGDRLPGEAHLRHLLIKRGFLPETADEVIRTYKDNWDLVKSTNGGFNRTEEEPMRAAAQDHLELAESVQPALKQPAPGHTGASLHVFSWPLSRGVTAEVRFTGGELSAAHFERLRQYLELAKQTWQDEESNT